MTDENKTKDPNIAEIGDDTFQQEVLESETPVLVDFWAPWCGPCKQIAPILSQVAAARAGKLRVVKINIDDHPKTPTQYGIRAIPTLLLFDKGELKKQQTGAVGQAEIDALIDS